MVDDDIPMNAGCLRPIRDHPARRLDALAALSGRGGGRQCRGFAGGDRHAVRRASRAGLGAGHDEQPHLRRRDLSILRDDLLGRARRPRLRRRKRGPHAHDEFPPDRPGSAGEPLSRRARGFPHPPRLRRQGPLEGGRRHAATHPFLKADECGDLERSSRRPQSGHDGRERRRTRPQLRPPQRRARRNPARVRCRRRSKRARRSRSSPRPEEGGGRGDFLFL